MNRDQRAQHIPPRASAATSYYEDVGNTDELDDDSYYEPRLPTSARRYNMTTTGEQRPFFS